MQQELSLDVARLKRARLENAWTQEELARKADVHPVTLARLETGRQQARKATIRSLAVALGVGVLDIASIVEASLD